MPTIVGTPQVTQITTTSAVVTWTTDVASDTQVEYGLTTAYGSATALNPAGVTSHSATITGLTPGTLYHLRVRSADATGSADPLTTAGIAARWRAADLTGLTANDPVALWASTVGGLVAQQGALASRPIWVPNVQNGRAGLKFDGIDDHLNAGDVLKFTGAFTAQFVLRFDDLNAYSMIFTKGADVTGTAASFQYEVRREDVSNHLQVYGAPGGTPQSASAADTTLSAFHVYTVVADPAGTAQWYIDGAAAGSAYTWSPNGTFTDTALDFVIGGRLFLDGSLQKYQAPMTLLELDLYSGALGATARHANELYLGSYYGISVT